MTKMKLVDEGLVQEISERVALALRQQRLDPVTLAAVENLRGATSRSTINRGLGWGQGEFIAEEVCPSVNASPDGNEVASFPKWGKEHLLVTNNIVAIGGNVKSSDVDLTWGSVALDVHAHEVGADPRELRIAEANGVDLRTKKYAIAKARVDIEREYDVAQLFTTAANFGGQTVPLTSGASGTQWSAYASANSDPVKAVSDADEVIRGECGQNATDMVLGPKPLRALRFHPKIQALVQYGSNKLNPSLPVGIETLVALFGKNIHVGKAVHTVKINGALIDTWGDCASLFIKSEPDLYAPQFALNLSSSGYPKTLEYDDPKRGAEGSRVHRYIDAFRPQVMYAKAGYLWTSVTGA